MHPGAWTPNDWLVVVGVLTLATYVIIAVYAKVQLDEARTLRREQTRPFVVVDFHVDWVTDLVIENVGQTVAYDVQMEFSPALASTREQPWSWEGSSIMENGIPTLPPGKSIRFSFDSIIELLKSDLPKRYEVTVTYKDSLRRSLAPDTYVLDLTTYEGSTPPEDGRHELVKEVKELRKEVHKWTDGSSGLIVGTIDRRKQAKRTRRQMRKGRRYRRRRYQPRSGWLGKWDNSRVKADFRWRQWRNR
jgi:hypothetical protein